MQRVMHKKFGDAFFLGHVFLRTDQPVDGAVRFRDGDAAHDHPAIAGVFVQDAVFAFVMAGAILNVSGDGSL